MCGDHLDSKPICTEILAAVSACNIEWPGNEQESSVHSNRTHESLSRVSYEDSYRYSIANSCFYVILQQRCRAGPSTQYPLKLTFIDTGDNTGLTSHTRYLEIEGCGL